MPKHGSIAGVLTIPIRYAHQVVEVVLQPDELAAFIQQNNPELKDFERRELYRMV